MARGAADRIGRPTGAPRGVAGARCPPDPIQCADGPGDARHAMKIRRLEIQGFKSFSDRTAFEFGDGITAIVGPNGCGKSNVVDAVKWVLGDMSPKSLRGKRMEDVIFAGSAGRKPSGLSEVTLVLDNADQTPPDRARRGVDHAAPLPDGGERVPGERRGRRG